ncbi:hypothetical protein SRHO_G00025920 [Serrasalmus rhombeus]
MDRVADWKQDGERVREEEMGATQECWVDLICERYVLGSRLCCTGRFEWTEVRTYSLSAFEDDVKIGIPCYGSMRGKGRWTYNHVTAAQCMWKRASCSPRRLQ